MSDTRVFAAVDLKRIASLLKELGKLNSADDGVGRHGGAVVLTLDIGFRGDLNDPTDQHFGAMSFIWDDEMGSFVREADEHYESEVGG